MRTILILVVFCNVTLLSCNWHSSPNTIIDKAKWIIYYSNYSFCGSFKEGILDTCYNPISCDIQLLRIDTISADSVELYFTFYLNEQRVYLLDTIHKQIIHSDGRALLIPTHYNSVMGVGFVNGEFCYPRYTNNRVPDVYNSSTLKKWEDSLESSFFKYAELHQDEMHSWLKEEFIKRKKNICNDCYFRPH